MHGLRVLTPRAGVLHLLLLAGRQLRLVTSLQLDGFVLALRTYQHQYLIASAGSQLLMLQLVEGRLQVRPCPQICSLVGIRREINPLFFLLSRRSPKTLLARR